MAPQRTVHQQKTPPRDPSSSSQRKEGSFEEKDRIRRAAEQKGDFAAAHLLPAELKEEAEDSHSGRNTGGAAMKMNRTPPSGAASASSFSSFHGRSSVEEEEEEGDSLPPASVVIAHAAWREFEEERRRAIPPPVGVVMVPGDVSTIASSSVGSSASPVSKWNPPPPLQGPPQKPSVFRLKPRKNGKGAKCTPSPAAHAASTRGRKRPAHSISSAPVVAAGYSTVRSNLFGGTASPEDEEKFFKHQAYAMGTHLQQQQNWSSCSQDDNTSATASITPASVFYPSRKQSSNAAPASPSAAVGEAFSSMTLQSPVVQRCGSNASGVTLPQAASSPLSLTSNGGRSGFSRYNPALDTSFDSSLHMRSNSMGSSVVIDAPFRGSSSTGTNRSSPKLAPLTVLQGDSIQSRPPLHEGPWRPLDEDDKDDWQFSPKKPPFSVDYYPDSSASVSTIHDHQESGPNKLDTSMESAEQFSDTEEDQKIAAQAVTPRQARSESLSSAKHTPLPRIALTPRSQRSNNNEGTVLPRFPSPSDLYENFSSALFSPTNPNSAFQYSTEDVTGIHQPPLTSSLHRSELESPHSLALSIDSTNKKQAKSDKTETRKESFIPFPDWGQFPPPPLPRVINAGGRAEQGKTEDLVQSNPFEGIKAKSVLHPSVSRGSLNGMFGNEPSHPDHDSLSDGPDKDEPFLLASPSAIAEEKQQQRQESFGSRKQRRLLHSTTSIATNSTASLRGMDFVASSASLRGMDRESSGSVPRLPRQIRKTSLSSINDNSEMIHSNCTLHVLNREESPASIGLTLEHTMASSSDDDSGGRDLVTPPAMARASSSPPPLTPKNEEEEYVYSGTPPPTPHCKTKNHSRYFVSNADSRSVAQAIALMVCHGSSPKDSSPHSKRTQSSPRSN